VEVSKKEFLLGFWYGHKLNDVDHFLTHGINRQIFYKIYETPKEINENPIQDASIADDLYTKL
jgi:hypothetical protein